VDASGQALEHFDLDRMPGRFKLIFCFQDACPGCHATGFPALARVVDAFRERLRRVRRSPDRVRGLRFEHLGAHAGQSLPLRAGHSFGHDAGDEQDGAGSELMRRYRNGGTPWFILIDPDGRVVYNHFRIDADKLVTFLKRLENEPAAPEPGPDMLTWKGVIQLVETGNPTPPRRVERSEAEWAQQLTPEQFRITRLKGTERAHSSSMCTLFSPGIYRCVCCGTELFDASTKYDSRSGWPSFTQAIAPGLVGYHGDNSHGMVRVETTCNVCDAHLGHVFPDGPKPSGLRYCINALALEKA
jgi:methionine-R-sulfoxide reductase